jgi:hypothetical protein
MGFNSAFKGLTPSDALNRKDLILLPDEGIRARY